MTKGSRFATLEEINSPSFQVIVDDMCRLHREYNLPNHKEINTARYPWSVGMQNEPEVYAARLWEYPFCILAANLEQGMICADIGCGMSAFTIYLKNISNCNILGVDPDLFEKGIKHLGHGVSEEFLERTNLSVVESMDKINNEYFDRVFCISVIEHVPRRAIPDLMREMTRTLKPGGLLVMTVDVNINYDMARPLDLIWQSGLVPDGILNLNWPQYRFGRAEDIKSGYSADVYGLVLRKLEDHLYLNYGGETTIEQTDIPVVRHRSETESPLPLRVRRYFKAEWFGR